MATTLDMIYSIAAGDSQEAQAAFEAITGERITAAINAKREALAKALFNGMTAEEEQEE